MCKFKLLLLPVENVLQVRTLARSHTWTCCSAVCEIIRWKSCRISAVCYGNSGGACIRMYIWLKLLCSLKNEWNWDWKSKQSNNLHHPCNICSTASNISNVSQMVWLGRRTAKKEYMKLISFSPYCTICCQFIVSVTNNKY